MAEQAYLTVAHLTTRDLIRIFSKISVNPSTGCWEWTAGLNHNGYGKIWHRGHTDVAHRFMYAWLVAPVPQGVSATTPNIDHLCECRRCCNPSHLQLRQPKQNTLRGHRNPTAINAKKTHCPAGHPLTETRVWNGTKRRPCLICHNDRAKLRRSTPEGHKRYLEYHRRRNSDPEVRRRLNEAMRRYRLRKKGLHS